MVGVCISLLFSHALADFGDVTDQHILYCRVFTESFHTTFHIVSCCPELIFPGILVIAGHIVSCMIARYDHERCEDHFFCFLIFANNGLVVFIFIATVFYVFCNIVI